MRFRRRVEIWGANRKILTLPELLNICVGDTLDADKGRRAFPKTKSDLLVAHRGQQMFDIARDALVNMAKYVPGYATVAARPDKFCRGFGIFQYDLQHFKTDPEYFLERRWCDFDSCLTKCIDELQAAMGRMGIAGQQTLTDLEKVHVAIAYNVGKFKPEKGLKQGYFDGKNYYGELIFDYLRLSQTVCTPSTPALVPAPAAGTAPVRPPTSLITNGRMLEARSADALFALRSEPRIDRAKPAANVVARLPDRHRVRIISGKRNDKFLEVETSLNGAHLRGFAESRFVAPVSVAREIPVATPDSTPPSSGIVAVWAPRPRGSITRRVDPAGALSLNEPDQPGRQGSTPEELRTELATIIDYLGVDKPSHKRYQPRAGATFCNIYAHDYCHVAGVYLPRVWWTQDAIECLAQGQNVEARLGATIDELTANALFQWLRAFGLRFGWRQTGTPTKLQTEINVGGVGLIVARRKADGRSGHIVVVAPETGTNSARRDASGEVIAPLQSQAGAINFRYGTGKLNWWKGEEFADSAFWIHA